MDTPQPETRISAAWPDAAWVGGESAVVADATAPVRAILDSALAGTAPTVAEIELLFRSHGTDVEAIADAADILRQRTVGDDVTFVVNRNINYTNQCYFKCGFCAFSKGPRSLSMRGEPYLLTIDEVVERSSEAWARGATEVCLQGGIHPDFTGQFYIDLVSAIKAEIPEMHIHGYTPLEIWQGAETAGVTVRELLIALQDAGLGTLPGTAAEILDDDVRLTLCPDKIRTAQWSEVMLTAHDIGLRTTSTMMFGHVDGPRSWANHIEVLRNIQRRTGGFTEFVPLPFVHMGSPIWLKGQSRPGPTWDEVILVHAVSRIAFLGLIDNIQASWVKLGLEGAATLLRSGCNDVGGTLMDESISRGCRSLSRDRSDGRRLPGCNPGSRPKPPCAETRVSADRVGNLDLKQIGLRFTVHGLTVRHWRSQRLGPPFSRLGSPFRPVLTRNFRASTLGAWVSICWWGDRLVDRWRCCLGVFTGVGPRVCGWCSTRMRL